MKVRVILPAHLRTLAKVDGEVQVEVVGQGNDAVTLGQVLDAIETTYPVLRGTIRDFGSRTRRPFLRYFACRQDFSHDPPETVLPQDIVEGREPFMVIGSLAGG